MPMKQASGAGYGRPRIGSMSLAFLVAFYLLAATNLAFWKITAKVAQDSPYTIAALAIVLGCIYAAFCVSVSVKYATKPIYIALILVAAIASWFMDSFGSVIDVNMLDSAVKTSVAESSHLLSRSFVLHMLLFAGLPAAAIVAVRIEHRGFWAKLLHNSAAISACLVIGGGALFAQSGSIFWLARQHREWTSMLNPVMPVASAVKLAIRHNSERNIVAQPLGTDARVVQTNPARPKVTVIVVGETARAENFSLGGYGRPTNPELAAKDVVYFRDTSSCGTVTAVSVPCMFSIYPRKSYTHEKGLRTENLTDVLGHAGIDVAWWDNDMGSKSVADRLAGYRKLYTSADPTYCADGECVDDVLLKDFGGWLDSVKHDSVLVLHIEGSHGPAYHDRYPEPYRRFTPDCRSAEFADCTHQEIVNAYDNTIVYTDHILASAISALEARDERIAPSLLFVSDHGESLGEYGLYLHGAPYFMAPPQQTRVPYLIWLGKDARSRTAPDCLAAAAGEAQSHDNLFHTVLGMMDVSTSVYDPRLDTLARCRRTADPAGGPLVYSSGQASGAVVR